MASWYSENMEGDGENGPGVARLSCQSIKATPVRPKAPPAAHTRMVESLNAAHTPPNDTLDAPLDCKTDQQGGGKAVVTHTRCTGEGSCKGGDGGQHSGQPADRQGTEPCSSYGTLGGSMRPGVYGVGICDHESPVASPPPLPSNRCPNPSPCPKSTQTWPRGCCSLHQRHTRPVPTLATAPRLTSHCWLVQ